MSDQIAELGDEIRNAPVVSAEPSAAPPPPDDPPPPQPDDLSTDQPPPKRPKRPHGEIFEGSPVKALGVFGDWHYFLDHANQLRAARDVKKSVIMSLYGHHGKKLCKHFPQQKPRKGRFDADTAAAAIYAACAERGLFDPDGAVRGVGAWTDDNGALVYHTGKALLVDGKALPPQLYQGRIYPAFPEIHPPAEIVSGKPGQSLLDTLETWNWQRADIDPQIVLGMVGLQMMGGALDWRPVFWITGARSSGKSTLQKLVEHMHGPKASVTSTDATERGITSQLRQSSLPVSIDELEAKEGGSSREKDIVKLARLAASGGRWLRSSPDQTGSGGAINSTFLFSSILIPGGLPSQDLSRIIRVNLNPLPESAARITLRSETWRERGAALKRVLIDRWPTWAQRLELWREALSEEGLAIRNGDNWAAVMAMSDMALSAELPDDDTLTGWSKKLAAAVQMEIEEIGDDGTAMLMHLLSHPFDPYRRGEQFTLAQWIMVAGQVDGAPVALVNTSGDAGLDHRSVAAKEANAKLAKALLRVSGTGANARLFMGNAPVHFLKLIFEHSEWAGGAWAQSAARVPGAVPAKNPLSLAGIKSRGWHIPFKSIPGLLGLPMDRGAPQSRRPADGSDLDGFA